MTWSSVSVSGATVKVNVDPWQIFKEAYHHMADAWMIKPLLILAWIILMLFLFEVFLSRKVRERHERKKAKIWREEYKNK